MPGAGGSNEPAGSPGSAVANVTFRKASQQAASQPVRLRFEFPSIVLPQNFVLPKIDREPLPSPKVRAAPLGFRFEQP